MADLPSRVRPPQVLLAVGAVLLLVGTLATPGEDGAGSGAALTLAALAAGAVSAWASRAGLRGTRETLAATAVVLAVAGTAQDGSPGGGSPVGPALLALTLAGVARLQPAPLSWPLGAWAAGQLAALRLLPGVPEGVPRTGALLAVSLAGLVVVLGARPAIARVVLVTTVPWWVLGVAGGVGTAWAAPVPDAAASAALTVAAAAGLLVVRLDRAVSPLLGPPRAVPVLAGAVSGAAVAGVLSGGPGSAVVAGYAGVLLAAVAAGALDGWRRGLLLPCALAAGTTLVACALTQLVGAAAWRELALLLLLTAAPSAAVARRRREDRPAAVPVAVGCLAAAALLAVPAGLLGPVEAAAVLTLLYAAALLGATGLAADTRRHTLAVAAGTAAAAVLLVAAAGSPGQVAAHLAAQGALTWLWAVYVGRRAGEASAPARAAGAAEVVAAAWTVAALGGASALEVYTLPAAAGLLLAAGPELGRRPSERAWGPGLLVAAVPSTVLAVVAPGAERPLLVLAAAAVAMVGGAAANIRTPLVAGAGTAVALAVGLAVVALPLPLAGALVAGVALLAVGARRELRPVGGFAERVAEMR
ncbi:SCO7613 C-terminal domain-containing membrane protein [Blastococcus sp. SYSU D00813]